ncbi:E3 ubiquitin-protein ligase march2 [Blomia tropicalis]|nr:E3 ubiquitin-protein ligase march2 [Blomia tropicalis]
MDEKQLNTLLHTRLCRFCGRRESNCDPFIVACRCQGPNSSIHKSCIEQWLSHSKQTKCDICRFDYILKYSYRSMWEWYEEASADSNLRQTLELQLRLMSIIYMLILSYAIIIYDKDNHKLRENRSKLVLGSIIIISCFLRIILAYRNLLNYGRLTWKHFDEWRRHNPKVMIEPNSTVGKDGRKSIQFGTSSIRAAGLRRRTMVKQEPIQKTSNDENGKNC